VLYIKITTIAITNDNKIDFPVLKILLIKNTVLIYRIHSKNNFYKK